MRNRDWPIWMLPLLGLCISLAGCDPQQRSPNIQRGAAIESQFDTREADVDGDGDRAILSGKNPINNPPWDPRNNPRAHSAGTTLTQGRYSGNAYADTIARLALSVPGVASSVAVASGRVIIVGVAVRRYVPRRFTPYDSNEIRREIRRRILVQAPEFRYVYVTVDRNQVAELNHIADGLRNGQPFQMYERRIRELMGMMTPVPLY